MRFVVLHHTGWGAAHFDVMLEPPHQTRGLITFRATRFPIQPGDVVEQLADHRREFLTYEGPISDARGHVKRAEHGTYELVAGSDANSEPICLRFTLAGKTVERDLVLTKTTRSTWIAQSPLLSEGH